MPDSTAIDRDAPASPLDHCYRENNCAAHANHVGDACCCCGHPANVHEGCDCE